MIQTFAFNPYIAIIFAMLGQTLLMIWQIINTSRKKFLEGFQLGILARILPDKRGDNMPYLSENRNKINNSDVNSDSDVSTAQTLTQPAIAVIIIKIFNILKTLLSYIFDGLFVIICLITLDTAFLWTLQTWIWSDWPFQLPTIILLFVFGIQFVLRLCVYRRSIIDIISFIISAAIFEYILRIYIVQFEVMGPYLEKALIIVFPTIIALTFIFRIISFAGMKFSSNNKKNNRSLVHEIFKMRGNDAEMNRLMKHKFNIWFNSVLWALIVLQMMLNFNGYSLFTFVQFFL